MRIIIAFMLVFCFLYTSVHAQQLQPKVSEITISRIDNNAYMVRVSGEKQKTYITPNMAEIVVIVNMYLRPGTVVSFPTANETPH